MATKKKEIIEEVEETETMGVGDKVESIIKKVLPKLAKKYEYCKGCANRKTWMNNNLNANFG